MNEIYIEIQIESNIKRNVYFQRVERIETNSNEMATILHLSETGKNVTELKIIYCTVNFKSPYQLSSLELIIRITQIGGLKSFLFDRRRIKATEPVDMIRQEISRLWLHREGGWLVAFWCTWLQDNESFLASTTYQSLPCHNTIDRDHSWMRREWRRAATVRLRRDPLYSEA